MPQVHPKLEPSLSFGPSPHKQQEEAHSPQRASTPEEYIQDTAAPSFGLVEAARPILPALASQAEHPVFGEQGEEASTRPPLAVGIVSVEKDEWESKFSELHEATGVPLPAAEDSPPPPSLETQPEGYTRDSTEPPPEDPGHSQQQLSQASQTKPRPMSLAPSYPQPARAQRTRLRHPLDLAREVPEGESTRPSESNRSVFTNPRRTYTRSPQGR